MFVLKALHSIAARLGNRKPNKSPLQSELPKRVICRLSLRVLQMTLGSLLSPRRDAQECNTEKQTLLLLISKKMLSRPLKTGLFKTGLKTGLK